MCSFSIIWQSFSLISSLTSLARSSVELKFSLLILCTLWRYLMVSWLVWEKSASQAGLCRDVFSSFPAQNSPNKERLSHAPESCLGKAGAVVIKVGTFMKYAFVSVFVALNQVNKYWLSVERGFLWDCVRPCRTINAWGALSNAAISDPAAGKMWGNLRLLEGGQLRLSPYKSRATSPPWTRATEPGKMVRGKAGGSTASRPTGK